MGTPFFNIRSISIQNTGKGFRWNTRYRLLYLLLEQNMQVTRTEMISLHKVMYCSAQCVCAVRVWAHFTFVPIQQWIFSVTTPMHLDYIKTTLVNAANCALQY